MPQTSSLLVDDLEKTVCLYGDMLFRICLVILANKQDAEDAVQETLIKRFRKAPLFESAEHEKAWLIAVATNTCRDMHRFRLRHTHLDIKEVEVFLPSPQEKNIFFDWGMIEALMAITEKFRTVLVLHYVEELKVDDVASIIGRTPSAVKMRLKKGRELLEKEYRKGSC